MFLDLLLREKGFDVLLADNGLTGVEYYRQEHPDVVFLDLNLPVLNGITVLELIRATNVKQKVIVMTEDTNPDVEQHLRSLGVTEFILKGVSLQPLKDTVKRLSEGNASDGNVAA